MAQVMMPQRRAGTPFGAVGSAVGSIYGPVGSAIGGAAGGMLDQQGARKPPGAVQSPGNAIDRRKQQLDEADPTKALEAGIQSLPEMPDEVRAEYEKPLMEAYQRARAQKMTPGGV